MAIILDGPVTPDALTSFVREVPTPANYVLNQLLPDRNVNSNQVDISDVTRKNRAAKFRAFDGRIHRSERDSYTTSSVKLPPLSSMNGIGELERLKLEFVRNGGIGVNDAIINAIYDDATNLTQEIHTRMELARGDVLTDGKFTLAGENGMTLEADFGVPAEHKVTAATVWSNPAATIIADITAWADVYTVTNGFRPGGMVVSNKVLGYLLRNGEVRALAAGLAGTPQLVSRATLDGVLDTFSLPPILFVYDTQVDVDDVSTRVLAEDKVLFTPPNPSDLGYTAWGVTATALELVNSKAVDFSFADAPGIVGVVEKSGPPYKEDTFVDAVGMPVLTAPKRLLVADVF